MAGTSPELAAAHDRLTDIVGRLGGVVVGLSGGVDSSLLARVAVDVLGDRAVAVVARSPSLPQRELDTAMAVARDIGIDHLVRDTREVDDPRYAANRADRCYRCKDELFGVLRAVADERGIDAIAYGENVDDDGDHRPGRRAAREHRVHAPLREAGLTKRDVRALARALQVPVWDKPAFACLASRFPTGQPISVEALERVEAAEEAVWGLGIRQLRVRDHGDLARIEVEPADFATVVSAATEVTEALARLGYAHVTLDLAGYRMGSTGPARRRLPVLQRDSGG